MEHIKIQKILPVCYSNNQKISKSQNLYVSKKPRLSTNINISI